MNLPRSGQPTKITPRARLIQEVIKEPRKSSKLNQHLLTSIKVSVHDSTTRKRLGKNGIHRRVPSQKPLLTKKNTKGSSHISQKISKKYLDYPQDFWANNLWTEVTNVYFFGRCVYGYIWRKTNTAFHKKYIIPTVKHGAGSVMMWGCFLAPGPG